MPTTSISDYSIINNGPLTTTFTAPASCSTAAYNTLIGLASNPTEIFWQSSCSRIPPADCYPNGTAVQSILQGVYSAQDPLAGNVILYHSPGIVCPSGWVTVGGAAKVNPTSTSISGAFNQSVLLPTLYRSILEPELDIFLDALDLGETAFVCCPSSYTPDGAGCISTIPTTVYTPSVGCQLLVPGRDLTVTSGTFTIHGETITDNLEKITSVTPLRVTTTTFASSEITAAIGVADQAMYILVQQASDTATTSAPKTTSSSSLGAKNGVSTSASLGVLFFFLIYCVGATVGRT